MKQAITNTHESIRANKDFHLSIAKAAHNNLLFSIMKYLFSVLNGKLWVNLIEKNWAIPGRSQKYLKEQTEIFNAIKNKDSKNARKRMHSHLTGGERDLFKKVM